MAVHFEQVLPAESDAWSTPISFDIPAGSFSLVRTTVSRSAALLRICAGLLQTAAGSAVVLGTQPGTLDRRAALRFRRRLGVGLVPDGLISNLTLKMNIIVSLLYSGVASRKESEERALRVLDECGVSEWAHLRPADVPLEVRQRAVLARAVAREPELMLLEDPLASLYASDAESLLSLARARVGTLLVTTHRQDTTMLQMADYHGTWDEFGFRMREA